MEDLDASFSAHMKQFSMGEYEEVQGCVRVFIDGMKDHLGLGSGDDGCLKKDLFTDPRSKNCTKAVLAGWLEKSCVLLLEQFQTINQMTVIWDFMKTESVGDKAKIIKLQDQLLESKEKQLQSLQGLQSAVETTVQSTMKKEIKLYSDAVGKLSSSPPITQQSLKNAVRSAINEETSRFLACPKKEKTSKRRSQCCSHSWGETSFNCMQIREWTWYG